MQMLVPIHVLFLFNIEPQSCRESQIIRAEISANHCAIAVKNNHV
jgi:hypothetical protein